tara:strand:- start:880 stop:3624 length:2745 start_codon:yes stop_codon:yes gene_type:complete
MYKNIFFYILLFISTNLLSQSTSDLVNQAANLGISSQEDILRELESRGMTIKDAETMARIYGIDYNEYISQYILENTNSSDSTLPVVSELVIQGDSVLEKKIPNKKSNNLNDSINYFGYDIFLNNPFANKEYLVGNIDEGYILAPGDVIRIYVFGDNIYQTEVKIDLNGNILLPDIGMFFASGYTFSSLKKRLNEFLGRSFSGLIDSPQRSFLDVSLTQLRPVKVTFLGESNAPGPHLVGGFATVLNALYSSGGIKISGSLRNIQVFRNNRLKKTIDLYDYITKGSLDGDIRLMNNDIIFIPVRENTVQLKGTIRNESIYELKKGEGINEILSYSGGLNANSSSLAVISRIKPLTERVQNETYPRFLTSFDISKSMSSSKEIYSVKKGEYLYAIAKKYDVKVNEIKLWNKLSSNILKIGQKLEIYNKDFELLDGDIVSFSAIPKKILNSVSVNGSVNRPGTYPLDKFSNLKSLILDAANNILPRTYLDKVDVSKENLDGSRSFKSYNLSDVLNGSLEVFLEDQDIVRVYSLNEVEGDDQITISGFGIEDSISIPWRKNISLYDFVFSNSPFNEKEFKSYFLKTRVDIKRYNINSGMYYTIPLDIENDKDFILERNDEVVLYSKDISKNILPTFRISGFVNKPGDYRLDSGMVIEDAILKANGLSEFALSTKVAINSLDKNSSDRSTILNYVELDMDYLLGKKDKPSSINLISDFDRISVVKDPKIKEEFTVTVIGEVNSPGSVTLEYLNESVNEVLNKAGGLTDNSSLGSSYVIRDSINIDFNFLKDINKNISFLRDNDKIIIGNIKDEITVRGSIPKTVKLLYSKNRSKYYLKNSGGRNNKTAGKSYVIYPSGKSKKISLFRNPKIYPGSDIFISFKLNEEKEKGRFFESFTTIFSILTGALTTVVLAKQLSN